MNTLEKLRGVSTWVGPLLKHVSAVSQTPTRQGRKHLIFALCDHFEPLWGGATKGVGDRRVQAWLDAYPELAAGFAGADGIPPQHSFFFPGEQYERDWLSGLARLAERGFGEVELHLHHDRDTPERLRRSLDDMLAAYAAHGHLGRDRQGRLRYGFIHGNWCLANARRDGRWCGVDGEIPLLHETGCYADFTFPSAPDECQPRIVNQLYWPTGKLARARAYESGERARVGETRDDRILIVQGPLAIWRQPGRLLPRIENGALTARDPATRERVRSWAAMNIHVAGRPDWVFVKVHTHGAPEANARSLLGAGGRMLHTELRSLCEGGRFALWYVTARELFNIAIAAMDGKQGDPGDYRDYVVQPPPVSS
jgi:hypothetical protein